MISPKSFPALPLTYIAFVKMESLIGSENHRGPADPDFQNSLDHHKTVIAPDTMVGFLSF